MKDNRLLEGIRTFSPLLQAYEAGHTKDEIMDSVYDVLSLEFEHHQMLKRYGLDLLTIESINVTKVKAYDWATRVYEISLKVRRDFLAKDANACSDVCSQWEQDIGKALFLYWNAVKFECNKSNLPLDEFAYELFRNIGSIIEGTFQVYLKELLHITLCSQGVSTSHLEITSLSLGNVVNRLSKFLCDADLFTLSPWMVPLNQWRNIAQHYSVDIDGSLIICKYGERNQHSITLNRKDLLDIASSIVLLFASVRTSQTIFVLDNADTLISHCKGFHRKDSDLCFQFCVGAASQGFEVTKLEFNSDQAFANFTDVTEDKSLERALHASQFVYQLWILSKSEKLVVKYEPKSKDKALITTAKSDDCAKVFNGEQQFSYLSDVVEYHVEDRI